MSETKTKKIANLEDPGTRAFMAAGEAFYQPDAINFILDEQRAFYDKYCAFFRKPRPAKVIAHYFSLGHIPSRRYRREGTTASAALLYLHGGGHVLGGPARASFAAIVEAVRSLAYDGRLPSSGRSRPA